MRGLRTLTSFERWDLGLLLTLLTVACLGLGFAWNYQTVPLLSAFARPTNPSLFQSVAASGGSAVTPPAPQAGLPVPAASGSSHSSVSPTIALQLNPKSATAYRWFNGQKYRYWKTIHMHVTAYAADPRCCWPFDGTTTASGLSVRTNQGNLVAADTRLIPMHALVSVPGYDRGRTVPVLDRGSAIKGLRLDVLMPTFGDATNWGVKDVDVKVYLPAGK